MGNALLVLATVSVLVALIYPRLADRAFVTRVDAVVADVDRLRAAANQVRQETGTWPPTGPVASLVPASGTEEEGAPMLTWRRLEAVEVPVPSTELADSVPEALDEVGEEIPPPEPLFFHRGAISLRSEDTTLLGALAERYPASFVHEGVWTLLLPRVPAPDGS